MGDVDLTYTIGVDGTIQPFKSDIPVLRGAGVPKAPSTRTVYMNVVTPMPFLRTGAPADGFRKLRKAVLEGAGFDFLAKTADMMRDKNFQSSKVGVANRSRHKCFSADTEVLTDEGWKLFAALNKTERVMTWKDGKLAYEQPVAYQAFTVDEELVHIKTRSVDLLVTKDHGMLVQENSPRRSGSWSDWKKIEAQELTQHHRIPTAGVCDLPKQSMYSLDFLNADQAGGWAEFMGWYLSEGYASGSSDGIQRTHNSRYKVAICQTKSGNFPVIESMLDKLQVHYSYGGREYHFHNKAIHNHLLPLGNSHNKRIPRYLLEHGSREDLLRLLDSLVAGDGRIDQNGNRIYWSVNKGLIDDISELCVKLGISNSVTFKPASSSPSPLMRGKPSDMWVLRTRKNTMQELRRGDGTPVITREHYAGMVYCVTTNAGALVVRRNGKVVISANCGDAFDYDQSSRNLVIVKEPIGLQTFFRTWLRTAKQDGSLGVQVALRDIRGHTVKGWYFDFTACAERLQWRRIPAWTGWALTGSGYNKMEFWHYQLTEGLSFDEAMEFLYGNHSSGSVRDVRKPNTYRVLGLNDRGSAVRNIQDKLSKILDELGNPYLPRQEVDGVYGKVTQTAVKRLQERYKLDVDGLVGPHTRQLIETLVSR